MMDHGCIKDNHRYDVSNVHDATMSDFSTKLMLLCSPSFVLSNGLNYDLWIAYPTAGGVAFWPHQVVCPRTTVSGIHVLWDWTSFNGSFVKLEMAQNIVPLECVEGGHLETILEAPGITGILADNCWTYSGSQISVRITMPVTWHMRELTSSKSATGKEW